MKQNLTTALSTKNGSTLLELPGISVRWERRGRGQLGAEGTRHRSHAVLPATHTAWVASRGGGRAFPPQSRIWQLNQWLWSLICPQLKALVEIHFQPRVSPQGSQCGLWNVSCKIPPRVDRDFMLSLLISQGHYPIFVLMHMCSLQL